MIDREAEGSDSLEVHMSIYYISFGGLTCVCDLVGIHVDALNSWWYRLRSWFIHPRTAQRQVPEEAYPDLLRLPQRTGRRCRRTALQLAAYTETVDKPRRLGRCAR